MAVATPLQAAGAAAPYLRYVKTQCEFIVILGLQVGSGKASRFPFDELTELRAALGLRDDVSAVLFYAAFGGVPRYWDLVQECLFATVEQALDQALTARIHHVAGVWEDVCRQRWHRLWLAGIEWEPAGRYWGRREPAETEWDVVSVSADAAMCSWASASGCSRQPLPRSPTRPGC